jgi:hypothetical protein
MFTTSASNRAVRAQWKIDKIVPKGDMSGDGRIDVSPDGKRLLLSIDMGEESGRRIGMGRCGTLGVRFANAKGDKAHAEKRYFAATAFGSTTTTFFFSAAPPAKKRFDLWNVHRWEKSKTPDQECALSKCERSGCMKQFVGAILPDVCGRQKPEAARETRANAQRDRAVKVL